MFNLKKQMDFNGKRIKSDDSIDYLYKALSKHKPLSKFEEAELIEKAKAGSLSARNTLIEKNLRYVFFVAKKYAGSGVPLIELVSEGTNGLFNAIERFDTGKGVKFLTYATGWIKDAIRKHLDRCHKVTELERYDAFYELENCGLDLDETRDVYEQSYPVTYALVSPKSDDDEMSEFVRETMKVLDKSEHFVITKTYGLNDEDEHILTDISDEMGVSVERVRQLRLSGIRKMREQLCRQNIMSVRQVEDACSKRGF